MERIVKNSPKGYCSYHCRTANESAFEPVPTCKRFLGVDADGVLDGAVTTINVIIKCYTKTFI